MNKEEIDEMMSHLPSQRPSESMAWKIVIGMWFVMFLILCAYAPDIRYSPDMQYNPEEITCVRIPKSYD
jgi:hypothetical protein